MVAELERVQARLCKRVDQREVFTLGIELYHNEPGSLAGQMWDIERYFHVVSGDKGLERTDLDQHGIILEADGPCGRVNGLAIPRGRDHANGSYFKSRDG